MANININKIGEALNTKADIDLNNTGVFTTTGGGVNLVSSTSADANGKEVTSADFIKSDIQTNLLNYTTNRILEIPQNIKLELNDGTLTLKAGSKVYIPNGFESDGTTPKFDIITLTKDLIYVEPTSNALTLPLFVSSNGNGLFRRGNNNSGKTVPDNYNGAFYNLTTNKMESYNNGSLAVTMSLPVCICTNSATSGNNMVSINQLFNGFGYIGSTIFALPGVKCLVGNGRNPDGSCITKHEETTNISVYNVTSNRQNNKFVLFDGSVNVRMRLWFDEQENICFNNATGIKAYQPTAILGTFSTKTTSPFEIIEFNPMSVDSFANSSASNFSKVGESYLSSLSMPSSKYIDLTLGASGTTYTAPANGWFTIHNEVTGNNRYFTARIALSDHGFVIPIWTGGGSIPVRVTVPCLAGSTFIINYNCTINSTPRFRFIYAQGEQ